MNVSEMMLKKVSCLEEIRNIMYTCSDVFIDEDLKSKKTIEMLAHKFAQLAEFYAMYSKNEICGFISYYCYDDTKSAFISMLMIREEFQRIGIGKEFLKLVINDCINKGKEQIRLEVLTDNAKAISFYKKNSFVKECSASHKSDFYALDLRDAGYI